MDAPKSRYRVVEKDGRLIVIDNQTGSRVSPHLAPPPSAGLSTGADRPPVVEAPESRLFARRPESSAPVIAGRGMADGLADFLLAFAVQDWDSDGNAIVHWRWKQNGQEKRWDAALDPGQQRRLGRALVRLGGIPILVLSFIAFSGIAFWLGVGAGLALVASAMSSISRLMTETAGQDWGEG